MINPRRLNSTQRKIIWGYLRKADTTAVTRMLPHTSFTPSFMPSLVE
jgi:hypothetical protein